MRYAVVLTRLLRYESTPERAHAFADKVKLGKDDKVIVLKSVREERVVGVREGATPRKKTTRRKK